MLMKHSLSSLPPLFTVTSPPSMEASHFVQSRILVTTPAQPRHTHGLNKLRSRLIVGVLTTPTDIRPADATEEKRRVHNDNWFDLMAINYLSKNLQAATGMRNNKTGFESLVEATTAASRIFKPEQQREVAIQSLKSAIPTPVLTMIRTVLPDSQFTRETFAIFTTIFFAWLVGPSEVRESELNGRKEKNVVHIKKCRFLEESNCVGMCINLCKVPSQTFIKDYFGIPVNMVPNFDDMSCEMVFGQHPPELSDDPALKQPCFKLCKVTQRHTSNDCSK